MNSSTNATLNATKIGVMKVGDVEVVKVGPELLFLIYKCVFFGIDAKRLRVELTLAQCGSVSDGPVGPEVAPRSVLHGHNFIEVCYSTECRIGTRLRCRNQAKPGNQTSYYCI